MGASQAASSEEAGSKDEDRSKLTPDKGKINGLQFLRKQDGRQVL